MAQGDIKSVTIENDGFTAAIKFDSMGWSGSLTTGYTSIDDTLFTSSYVPKFTLNVTSIGWTDTGEQTTANRTVVGTKVRRLPYPNNTKHDHTIDGSDVIVKCLLSDYIYASDTNITADILGEFYTSASINSGATSSLTVTNNSSFLWQKVIGNWYWPPYEAASAVTTYRIRCGAFHVSAQQAKPVRVIKFIAKDASGNEVSDFVTTPILSEKPDSVKVIEYVYNVPLTTLSQDNMITCSFIAYPWFGDTGSILNTQSSSKDLAAKYSDYYFYNDKNNTYKKMIAVVNPYTGNDSTGQVVETSSFNVGSPPNKFLTINGAWAKIYNYNNASHSRADVGGGIVYLDEGHHVFPSGSTAIGNEAKTYLTIKPFPTATRDNTIIYAGTSTKNVKKLKVENINFSTISGSAGNYQIFNGMSHVWFDQCYISASWPSLFNPTAPNTAAYYTHNTCSCLKTGMTATNKRTLVRGNDLREYNTTDMTYVTIGNSRIKTRYSIDDSFYELTADTVGMATGSNLIIAYNKFMNFHINAGSPIAGYSTIPAGGASASYDPYHGSAIVQNLLEIAILAGASNPAFTFGADSSTAEAHNLLIWHNTIVGSRVNAAYNDIANGAKSKTGWNFRNNLFDDNNCKTDIFATTGSCIGNWSAMNQVGCRGNINGPMVNVGSNTFAYEFVGLNSKQWSTASVSASYYQFINRQSYNGYQTGSGNGDYHLSASSPIVLLSLPTKYDLVLPYDIDGNERSSLNNFCGVFAFGSASSGGGSTINYLIPASMFFSVY